MELKNYVFRKHDDKWWLLEERIVGTGLHGEKEFKFFGHGGEENWMGLKRCRMFWCIVAWDGDIDL